MCVVLELLSQLEALGVLQRQEHKWVVGTRWLGIALADAAAWEAAVEVMALQVNKSLGTKELVLDQRT